MLVGRELSKLGEDENASVVPPPFLSFFVVSITNLACGRMSLGYVLDRSFQNLVKTKAFLLYFLLCGLRVEEESRGIFGF